MSSDSVLPGGAQADGAPVYVVGGGPAGLAAAASLRAAGVRSVVLEKAASVGDSWRHHYDRLQLHTTRRLSGLPGLAIPRRYGRWVRRDDVVRYLEEYAGHHELEIVPNVAVTRIDPVAAGGGGGWRLRATGGRELTSPIVVIATGYNHTPYVPEWPGRDAFGGELLHAAHYRNAAPYAGKDVLVVGVGNTGAEIAVDLVEGGASRVRLAVRTLPHILRRTTAGWPAQLSGILCRRLPVRMVDRMASRIARMSVPDLGAYGLPWPASGLYTRVREGAIPVQDVGLIDAVQRRAVIPVPAVASFRKDGVVLADGETIRPDVVIAATGYGHGLERVVGHLGVLDERGLPLGHGPRPAPGAEGLHFIGYSNPISGNLREIALDARKLAQAVTRSTG